MFKRKRKPSRRSRSSARSQRLKSKVTRGRRKTPSRVQAKKAKPHRYPSRPVSQTGDTDMEQRIQDSIIRQKRKQKHKLARRKAKKARRTKLLLSAVFLVAFALIAVFVVKKYILTDPIQSIPDLRANTIAEINADLQVTDTSNRQLTSAEREADVNQLMEYLDAVPQANALGKNSEGLPQLMATFKEEALNAENDAAYFAILERMVLALGDPQSAIVSVDHYNRLAKEIGSGFYEPDSTYAKSLRDSRVVARYQRLQDELTAANEEAQAEESTETVEGDTPAETEASTEPEASEEAVEPPTPVEEEVILPRLWTIEGTNIAVIDQLDFSEQATGLHAEILEQHFEQANSANAIIIDLRNQSGQSSSYWAKNILPYISTGNVGASSMIYFPQGFDSYMDYLSVHEQLVEFDLQEDRDAISMLTPQTVQDQITDLDFQKKITYSVLPSNKKVVSNSVVLLVDGTTTGAAETFADFCLANSIVAVAGQPTGGKGWNVPPFLVKLDHSGLLVSLNVGVPLTRDESALQKDAKVLPSISLEGGDLIQLLVNRLR